MNVTHRMFWFQPTFTFFIVQTQGLTLQEYFNNLLQSRGYSTKTYSSLQTAYSKLPPTPLQIASYGTYLIQAIRTSNKSTIQSLLRNGLSPNPCNKFGEGAIHLICRHGKHDLLELFLDYGCNIQICDDFGRTPLHDACWTSSPNFELVKMILKQDVRLMNIVDCRGCTPLDYVKREYWLDWITFLESVKDDFWVCRDVNVEGEQGEPCLVGMKPGSVKLETTRVCTEVEVEDVKLMAMGQKAVS